MVQGNPKCKQRLGFESIPKEKTWGYWLTRSSA